MVAKPRGVHHGSAHLQQQEMVKIEMSYWIVQLITHSKNARDIFLVGVNNIRVADRADLKLLVSHVQHLGDGHGRLGVTFGRNIVEEEFKVANDDELSEPAFLNAARFRYFDVTFVGRPDTSGRIDAQWPFSCKESTGKLSSVCLSIPKKRSTHFDLLEVGREEGLCLCRPHDKRNHILRRRRPGGSSRPSETYNDCTWAATGRNGRETDAIWNAAITCWSAVKNGEAASRRCWTVTDEISWGSAAIAFAFASCAGSADWTCPPFPTLALGHFVRLRVGQKVIRPFHYRRPSGFVVRVCGPAAGWDRKPIYCYCWAPMAPGYLRCRLPRCQPMPPVSVTTPWGTAPGMTSARWVCPKLKGTRESTTTLNNCPDGRVKKKKLTDYCADGTGRHANDRRLNGNRQKKKIPQFFSPFPIYC